MRVLLAVKGFDFGGAENHVRELANLLSERGHDVFVLAGGGRQISLLNNSVKYKCLIMRDLLIPFQVAFVWYFLIRNRIQVIHAHQRLPILLTSIAGKIRGIPTIVTIHGRTRYDLRYMVTRRFPSKFIFVSNQVLQVSAKREEIISRSVIVQNWTSVTPVSSEKRDHSICYISRIDKKHSSVILLILNKVIEPLAKKFPQLTFTVIGEGDSLNTLHSAASYLNQRLRREVCIIAGFSADVRAVIRHSGLVIGVGRVAIESLSCGTPLLSVNNKHMGSIISTLNYSEYMRNNFLDVVAGEPNAEGLINKLEEYLNDPGYWQREALLLQQYIDADFNREKLLGAIEDIYESSVIKNRASVEDLTEMVLHQSSPVIESVRADITL